jgi:ribosome-associated toxin RatA of RatAB toxin-antitoxin module
MACRVASVSDIRGPVCRIAFATLLMLSQCVAAATIAISGASNAATIQIAASALLNADAATAWHVLTDYERYVDFIPGLRASRVVARKGTTVTVEQFGEVMLWPLHVPLDVTFEITEIAPTHLVSRVVAGDLRALDSRYVLTPAGNGVRLEYTGKLNSGAVIFGSIERLAVQQNVGRGFEALADEIERRSAASHGQSNIELPQDRGTRVSAVSPAPER